MNPQIGILVIHGMGSQRPGYADELIDAVADRLGDRAGCLVWQEIHWASALRNREERLQSDMARARTPRGEPIDLRWQRTREFVVHNFGDAIAYHRDSTHGSAYRLVHELISASVTELSQRLDDLDSPVVVLAHSLGAHMMSNYIWDSQLPAGHARRPDGVEPIPMLASMITFGCSIPLFSLSFDVARPILLPGPDVPAGPLRLASSWINLIDADDVLAWPLRPLYGRHLDRLSALRRKTVERIEDRPMDAGGLLRAWNPASHTAYDTDDDLAMIAADHLDELFDAIDDLD